MIFGENTAAETGLIFALSAAGLTMIIARPVFQPLGTVAVGLLVTTFAIKAWERGFQHTFHQALWLFT